ncbi:MAG: hypothetical protein ACFFD5_06385 [Candidatus Thorarchaeota archaeon]
MNETEKIKEEEQQAEEKKKKSRFSRTPRKTQGQMIQEALGMNPKDIKDVEEKLFIARFLDYFSEETLDFIYKDRNMEQYLSKIVETINNLDMGDEEDKLLKMSFEEKQILETIQKIKTRTEELALSKGVKMAADKRLRRLTLYITVPMFIGVFALALIPNLNIYFLLPLLCVFCMLPQFLRSSVLRKWFRFKEENKNDVFTLNREDIIVLKSFAGETLNNIRAKLVELKVPLQLIKFTLHSRDYENLSLINQRSMRGVTQYYYNFEYPEGIEAFPIPEKLQQFEPQTVPEAIKKEKSEKNFIVLTEMKGKDGIIESFIPTLKDSLADKINQMLNDSDFTPAKEDFKKIIPNYSEKQAIYCVCGEIAEIINTQICNWKNKFKYYLFEGMKCDCGEKIYVVSLMDESSEIPEELREIFQS